jgi:hypothetical protein
MNGPHSVNKRASNISSVYENDNNSWNIYQNPDRSSFHAQSPPKLSEPKSKFRDYFQERTNKF